MDILAVRAAGGELTFVEFYGRRISYRTGQLIKDNGTMSVFLDLCNTCTCLLRSVVHFQLLHDMKSAITLSQQVYLPDMQYKRWHFLQSHLQGRSRNFLKRGCTSKK